MKNMKKLKILLIVLFFTLIVTTTVPAIEEKNHTYIFDFSSNSFYKKYSIGQLKNTKVHGKTKENRFMFFGYGTLNFGQVTYYPFTPVEGDKNNYTYALGPNPAKPYNFSYSFGIGVDYRILDFLGIFVDGGYNTWKLLLAKKDGYAYGQWVYNATQTSAVVGPFTMDTYYYMDTTVVRVGARYVASRGLFQPWIGAGVGMYAWQATIGNRQQQKKIGDISSGISIGYSFLGGGDIVLKDFVIRIYVDYGSGLAYPKITGLLSSPYDSAVFETTAGEHATGPYKVGVAFGVKY